MTHFHISNKKLLLTSASNGLGNICICCLLGTYYSEYANYNLSLTYQSCSLSRNLCKAKHLVAQVKNL